MLRASARRMRAMHLAHAARPPLPACVGRQPIYDGHLRVDGYELLFRLDESRETAEIADADACTAAVLLNAFLDIGLETVVGSRRAYVNATRQFLLDGLAFQLPADKTVVEVLESVEGDAEIVACVRALREAGYSVALDDFQFGGGTEPLLPHVDIVKVDLSGPGSADLADVVSRLRRPGLRLLAERVETREDFDRCAALGFQLFQGYFLARPNVVRGRRRSPHELSALRLLSLLQDYDVPVEVLVSEVSRDPQLTVRLLRAINSAAFGLRHRVSSLREALVLLGRARLQGWVSLMVLAGLSKKPPSITTGALARARMCELLATRGGVDDPAACFTVGLFSSLPLLLDTTWEELSAELPLSDGLMAALVRGEGSLGALLGAVQHYERCEWDGACLPGFRRTDLGEAYLSAIGWAEQLAEPGEPHAA